MPLFTEWHFACTVNNSGMTASSGGIFIRLKVLIVLIVHSGFGHMINLNKYVAGMQLKQN